MKTKDRDQKEREPSLPVPIGDGDDGTDSDARAIRAREKLDQGYAAIAGGLSLRAGEFLSHVRQQGGQ